MSGSPVVVITGASSGIGEATAHLLGREGYRLVLAARRFKRLEELANKIVESGGQALPVKADVSRLDDIENLVNSTIRKYGQIDVLFNNAGFGRLNWLEKLDPHIEVNAQINVNLLGVIHVTREVLPHMIERRRGHIINMSSIAGYIGTPTYTLYAASKFGIRGFTEALRRETSVWGINVSGVYPAGLSTEFNKNLGLVRKSKVRTPAWMRRSGEDVAENVLKVIERPRRTVVIPWFMRILISMNTLFPTLVDWLVERQFTRKERGM